MNLQEYYFCFTCFIPVLFCFFATKRGYFDMHKLAVRFDILVKGIFQKMGSLGIS